jgi:transcriptional regulator with XRE-family HTH domain
MKKRKYPVLRKVKGRMREMGITYPVIVKKMGISEATLCNKLNGYTDLKANEIEQLATILNIPGEKVIQYFFPDMLRNVS